MKKRRILLLSMLLAIMFILIVSGCSKTIDSVKTGVYVTADGMSYLMINESEETFEFQRGVTSYTPDGKYIIDGDKLLLYINGEMENTDFEFTISGGTLIFESGELAEGIIEKGTEFIYEDED
ncbi:MAG TPA: hypothetical protein VFC60_01460 [Tissierellaceae bacterium]|nr:hypothetical protein [Tissierellaceae bacterium]